MKPSSLLSSSLSSEKEKKRKKKKERRDQQREIEIPLFPLHFLARTCAHLRAHIISLFFLRARAHAREKVTRIAIIDRPLSMIVGGRVGALFFIVCFLSVLEIQIERFCISPPACGRLNEWKELGKNGQRGFEYGEFWLARASFSPFLCSFLCRRVIAYLLSSSSKKKSTTTHGGKSIFWERIPAFHFLKRDLSTVA